MEIETEYKTLFINQTNYEKEIVFYGCSVVDVYNVGNGANHDLQYGRER